MPIRAGLLALTTAMVPLVVALPGSPAEAAGRPDLRVLSASTSVDTVTAGQVIVVKDTVRNTGTARSSASSVRYLLSRDTASGNGDVTIGSRRVPVLAAGRRSSASALVTMPAATRAASYYVLSCADAGRQVRESNERNNCRATARVRVQRPAADVFPMSAAPVKVEPVIDSVWATSQVVVAGDGATLQTVGADGTFFTLTIPPRALAGDVEVTMTPVTAMPGSPYGDLVGAVEITPHGLRLDKPATLLIEPAAAPPVAEQTGFVAEAGGEDFHQYPLRDGEQIRLSLSHFSTPGVAVASPAQRATAAASVPASTEAQLEMRSGELVREARAAELQGQTPDPSLDAQLEALSTAYFEQVVVPHLQQALNDDAMAETAVSEALAWARQAQLLGMDELASRLDTDLVLRVIKGVGTRAVTRCEQDHDLGAIRKALWVAHELALLGAQGDADTLVDGINRCAHFDVELDVDLTRKQDLVQGSTSFHEDGRWWVATDSLTFSGLDLEPSGGVLDYLAASMTTDLHEKCPFSDSFGDVHEELTGSVPGTASARLALDPNVYDPAAGRSVLVGHLYLWFGDDGPGSPIPPQENYHAVVNGCGVENATDDSTRVEWLDTLAYLHDGTPSLDIPFTTGDRVGAQLAELVIDRTVVGDGADPVHRTERTTVVVKHTPGG